MCCMPVVGDGSTYGTRARVSVASTSLGRQITAIVRTTHRHEREKQGRLESDVACVCYLMHRIHCHGPMIGTVILRWLRIGGSIRRQGGKILSSLCHAAQE